MVPDKDLTIFGKRLSTYWYHYVKCWATWWKLNIFYCHITHHYGHDAEKTLNIWCHWRSCRRAVTQVAVCNLHSPPGPSRWIPPSPADRCSRGLAEDSRHQPIGVCDAVQLPRPTHEYPQITTDTQDKQDKEGKMADLKALLGHGI